MIVVRYIEIPLAMLDNSNHTVDNLNRNCVYVFQAEYLVTLLVI